MRVKRAHANQLPAYAKNAKLRAERGIGFEDLTRCQYLARGIVGGG
jgi:hypothetical protein